MEYQIKIIKVSPNKNPGDRLMDYNSYDRELFNSNMTADEAIEVLQHLDELRFRKSPQLQKEI